VLTALEHSDPATLSPASLFSPLDIAARRVVVVAVSGGSDSTALLSLFVEHVRRAAPSMKVVAATVDHALRPESAQEAALVGAFCKKLGIDHHVLTWTGEKPKSGLLAAARDARHDLLAGLARREGADVVLTGHTADDQAETVTMRRARGGMQEDGRGLAGIAPATLFDGDIWFARPLLATRREALREYLRQRQIGWIDDPTNVDDRYERPVVRKSLSGVEGEVTIVDALRIADDAGGHRTALGKAAAELIEAFADRPAPGLLRLQRDVLNADCDAATYALRILLAVAGGTPHLPDDERSAALYRRLVEEMPMRAVLSRALVDSRAGGIFILREARNLPESAEGVIWDGRYRLTGGHLVSPQAMPTNSGIPDSLINKAGAAQPPANLPATTPILAPWARYLPSFDLAPARVVASLVGAGKIPAPPFAGHD